MALIKVKTGGVDNSVNLGRRNLIINGAMQVSQRYGYNSAQTDWNSYDASDRMFKRTAGASTSSVQTRNDDAPSGFIYSDKLTITSQDSDTYIGRGTCLEWNDISHLRAGYSDAKTITLSFWVKASISGTYCFAYTSYVSVHSDGNAATSYVTEYTVNSANTWEYKTITVTLPTSTPSNWDGSNGGNTTGLRLQWTQSRRATTNSYETATTDSWISGNYFCTSSQTNMGATNGSTFQITGLQLEVGNTTPPFEHRSVGEELALCQRYFQKISGGSDAFVVAAKGQGTASVDASIPLTVPLRASPTMNSINSRSFSDGGFVASSSTTPTALQYSDNNTLLAVNCGGFTGLTNNEVQNWGPVSNTLTIDAEL